jgi:hypothetical protein
MSDVPESEVRIESLRDGGFIIYRGYQSPHSLNQPAKAVSTLGEALTYVATIMGPNASSGRSLADAIYNHSGETP